MARVDYEGVLSRLKSRVAEDPGKTSWGQRELRLLIADLELECTVEESATETLFRRFGPELEELFLNRARELRGIGRDDQDPEAHEARELVHAGGADRS